ncbi:DUF4065 domain-containing protein [Erysipelothrix rhusiopathiae]|nr:DUF4065 domain-containing protein [Erysipelothrix rhusiopathiae]
MATRESVLAWIESNNCYLNYADTYANRMKTMKLAFLSDGIYRQRHGKNLFDSKFSAWKDGPVDNAMYAKHIHHDYSRDDMNILNEEELSVLKQVNDIYGIFSGYALSQLTHTFDSWLEMVDDDMIPFEKQIMMNSETIAKDFQVVEKNLNLFNDYSLDYSIQIINDVTLLIPKNEKELYDKYIQDNYSRVVEISEELKDNGDFLLFLNVDSDGEFTYAL